jgi:hypothetical protein
MCINSLKKIVKVTEALNMRPACLDLSFTYIVSDNVAKPVLDAFCTLLVFPCVFNRR